MKKLNLKGIIDLVKYTVAEGYIFPNCFRAPAAILAFSLLLLSEIIKLSLPYLSAQAINVIQVAEPNYLINAGWYLLAVFGALVVSWLLRGPGPDCGPGRLHPVPGRTHLQPGRAHGGGVVREDL